ncbi:hypothetical protein SAMN02745249_01688 [Atopostipes suicloacalis DSM 15692]|uniref:BNR/Asp-box repeat-containing protein n=1 Tax=Atopostipes suicloacalis DSM 15692 TaxID=1121025 RepID=A0A1M4YFT9_9LACT|nr:sialidase family protein [Atopostipes suicloacalis]SHF04625.1 hypothetical protein SAMN02745249_01688 [Atopostipes suicloacalis DSM 15692]
MKTFYIGLNDKLVLIKETTTGYDFKECLHEKQPTRLAFDPLNQNRLYCSTRDDGLWRSEDSGEHWEKVGESHLSSERNINRGLPSSKITSVAVSPVRSVGGYSVVYAGTEPSMLFYSEDRGRTFQEFKGIQTLPSKKDWAFPPRPYTHFVRWITPSYSKKDYLAISIEAGAVLHTNDHGKIWIDRPEKSPIDAHTLLAHPKAPGRLYAANGDGASNNERAYAESEDEGITWQYMSEGLEEHPYLYNMVLHPENPNDRIVSASKNASAAHGSQRYSTVYRKVEDESWKEIADGLPRKQAYTHYLANDPDKIGAFYAMNNYGVFYLADGAETWEQTSIPWEAYKDQRAYCFVVKSF